MNTEDYKDENGNIDFDEYYNDLADEEERQYEENRELLEDLEYAYSIESNLE